MVWESKGWLRWNLWMTRAQKDRLEGAARLLRRSQADIVREALGLHLDTILQSPELIGVCEPTVSQGEEAE